MTTLLKRLKLRLHRREDVAIVRERLENPTVHFRQDEDLLAELVHDELMRQLPAVIAAKLIAD